MRVSRWLVVVAVLGGVVLVLGVAVALVGVFLLGGISGLLGGPDESTPEVVAARENALPAAGQVLDDEVGGPVAAALGSRLRPVATGDWDACVEGERNWKFQDPYDLSCSLGVVMVVAGPRATFREDMLAFHDELAAAGWGEPYPGHGATGNDIGTRMTDAWDRFRGGRAETTGDGAPYTPSHLPSATYGRPSRDGRGDHDWRLHVEWAEPADALRADSPRMHSGWRADFVIDGAPATSADVVAALGDDEYGLLLTVVTIYFRE